MSDPSKIDIAVSPRPERETIIAIPRPPRSWPQRTRVGSGGQILRSDAPLHPAPSAEGAEEPYAKIMRLEEELADTRALKARTVELEVLNVELRNLLRQCLPLVRDGATVNFAHPGVKAHLAILAEQADAALAKD